jgi:hypothetical protein
MPVPMTRGRAAALIASAPEGLRQLLLDQLLEEAADALPQPGLDRIEPSRRREQRRLVRQRRAILVHGVVFPGARTPVMAR